MASGAQIECIGELRPGPRCRSDIVPADPRPAIHPHPPGIVISSGRAQDAGKYAVRSALADAEREVRITGAISRRACDVVLARVVGKISSFGCGAVRWRSPQGPE